MTYLLEKKWALGKYLFELELLLKAVA